MEKRSYGSLSWFQWLLLLSGVVIGLLSVPMTGYAWSTSAKDPAKGTAPTIIEKAIAKGDELSTKTGYMFGAGHGDNRTAMKQPDMEDCSGFVYWAYLHGAGLSLPGYGSKTAPATGAYSSIYGKYVKRGPISKVKRGDLLEIHNNGHVAIYLGKGATLADDGSVGPPGSNKGYNGVHIALKKGNFDIQGYDGVYIDMNAAVKDKKLFKHVSPDKLNEDVSGKDDDSSSKGATNTDSSSGKSNPYPFHYFIDQKNVQGRLGLVSNTGALSGTSVTYLDSIVNKINGKVVYLAMLASYVLLGFMLVVTIWYFVLPRVTAGGLNKFEDWTGLPAINDQKNTFIVLGNLLAGVLLVGVIVSQVYVLPMGLLLKLLAGLTAWI